jgi:hypothetical protein
MLPVEPFGSEAKRRCYGPRRRRNKAPYRPNGCGGSIRLQRAYTTDVAFWPAAEESSILILAAFNLASLNGRRPYRGVLRCAPWPRISQPLGARDPRLAGSTRRDVDAR